jgi:hypothetical protein
VSERLNALEGNAYNSRSTFVQVRPGVAVQFAAPLFSLPMHVAEPLHAFCTVPPVKLFIIHPFILSVVVDDSSMICRQVGMDVNQHAKL